ncbi:3-hydroxybutyryl-CoA dehydrogenase [Micromonospora sp. NPDC049047]
MPVEEIAKVGVVGCGVMGAGLVELCARAGLPVRVAASSRQSAERGRRRLASCYTAAVERGRMSLAERARAEELTSFSADLADLADCDLVIESVTEVEELKVTIFKGLSTVVPSGTVLASNTSSIPLDALVAAAGGVPVLGLHFFNPVPVMPLVELARPASTDESVAKRVSVFLAERLGKEVIRSANRPGLIVNALLVPYLLDAIRMVESGHATADDIDRGMVAGCGYPMGPLRLADMVGLDTLVEVAERLFLELANPSYKAPALLFAMVAEGRLGRKSGHGFYRY